MSARLAMVAEAGARPSRPRPTRTPPSRIRIARRSSRPRGRAAPACSGVRRDVSIRPWFASRPAPGTRRLGRASPRGRSRRCAIGVTIAERRWSGPHGSFCCCTASSTTSPRPLALPTGRAAPRRRRARRPTRSCPMRTSRASSVGSRRWRASSRRSTAASEWSSAIRWAACSGSVAAPGQRPASAVDRVLLVAPPSPSILWPAVESFRPPALSAQSAGRGSSRRCPPGLQRPGPLLPGGSTGAVREPRSSSTST